jgi:hypothetical protein
VTVERKKGRLPALRPACPGRVTRLLGGEARGDAWGKELTPRQAGESEGWRGGASEDEVEERGERT